MMKNRILCLMAMVMVVSTMSAQRLQLQRRLGDKWGTESVSMKNKPKGTYYRLREDIQCQDLPRTPQVEDLTLLIAEPISIGWLTLYRRPLISEDYKFIVVLYDNNKLPIKTLNLCEIADNRYCEVQDVRWDADNRRVLFNMACPSYSSLINGKGSKLYSYDIDQDRIAWQTNWLTSNDIFILDDQYVYCSYGFTNEKDYLFLLDKFTGKVYHKLLTTKKSDYLELQEWNGKKQLYVVDNDEHLFIYDIQFGSQSPFNMSVSGEPKAFTVVYATSDDGFLNVRSEGSMKGEIIGRLESKHHDLGRGVLWQNGATWSKVRVGDTFGYVYNKQMGKQTWYDGKGNSILFARDYIFIYGEDFSDSGSLPVFTSLKPGTLLADHYKEYGDYYVLETGHDNLYIKKSDVLVRHR